MSDVSKKIAMFNQKKLNNQNTNSNNFNNNNNNINKKNDFKVNEDIKNKIKNEILKREEKKTTKEPNNSSVINNNKNNNIKNNNITNNNIKNNNSTNNKTNNNSTNNTIANNNSTNNNINNNNSTNNIIKNNNSTNNNITNNNHKNKFQNKLTIFENNSEQKKIGINKKENEQNIKSSENKNDLSFNKKPNEPKAISSEKMNIFNNKKEKNQKIISSENKNDSSFSKKQNLPKAISSEKMNIFNNKKEKEQKTLPSENKNDLSFNKNQNLPKAISSEKMNIFNKKKENEPKKIEKVNEQKNMSDRINIFSNNNNKKGDESKAIPSGKNKIINNNKDKEPKNSTADKINIFNNNKKEKEAKTEILERAYRMADTKKENEPKGFSDKINIFSNNKKVNEPKHISKSNKKENESNYISKEKNDISKSNKKENEQKTKLSDRINIFTKNETKINHKSKPSLNNNNDNINTNKNESNNIKSPSNNVFNIIDKFNNKSRNDDDEKNILRKVQTINYSKNNNSFNINNEKNIKNKNKDNNEKNNNELNSNENSNLNINKIQDEKINESNNKPNKRVFNSPPVTTKMSSNIPSNICTLNEDEIGEIFIESNLIPETVINESFCMGFFMTSFNLENPQMIENSLELYSDCGHNMCTLASAIRPEIIFRYPKKDTKDFEISELGASMCFPNGIKICYCSDKNEMHVRALKNYSCILTNQNGKRYYMMTYHYFYKIPIEEFNINNEYYSNIDNQLMDTINNSEYIYIPYCLSLLSKYPYFNQMEKCLESMRFALDNYHINPSEIYNLIIYYIKSIPIPPVGAALFFPIPYCHEIISINQPYYKDIILFGDNPAILLEYLTVEEIILIFRLLLFEQKIIIVGNNYDAITQLTYNFILLLYPLQWVHTYISIMTEKMMKYLNSFLPFFNGMHISLYELTSNILESIKENIFIIDINQHTFEMNTFPNLNTKNIIKKINEMVPQLPKNIYNNLTFGLGILKSYYDKKKEVKTFNLNNLDEMKPINTKIKQVFIQSFLEILYDYKNFLSIIGNKPIFNINGLLEKRPKNESNFYKELSETQLFQMFIQNNPVNVTKQNETFFEEQLEIYSGLKNKTDFREEFINNNNITCDIYKYYIIRLDSLENFDISNNNKINFNEDELSLNNYKKYIKLKYAKYETFFKQNYILKVNKRVIDNKIVLEYNKIPSKYNFYIIPNQEFNFEVEKRKKSIRIKNTGNKTLAHSKPKKENENELTQEEKDDIKENIIDVLTKIFKNEEISDIQESKKLIMDSISSDYGKDLYTNILYQNNNISNESSFQFLNDIIFKSITKILNSKSKEKQLIYCVKLIKSCNNFRKEENKKFIFLSDVLFPKLKKFPIIENLEFWKEWALLDVKDNNQKSKTSDEKWTDALDNIEKSMGKMGLNKTIIYSTIANLAKNNIQEETTFLKHMRKVVENLQIFKR